jgi:hypothetical protein
MAQVVELMLSPWGRAWLGKQEVGGLPPRLSGLIWIGLSFARTKLPGLYKKLEGGNSMTASLIVPVTEPTELVAVMV